MSEQPQNFADPGQTAGPHIHFTSETGISNGANPANEAPSTTGPANESSHSSPYTRLNYQNFIPRQTHDGFYLPARHAIGNAHHNSHADPVRPRRTGEVNTSSHMGGGQVMPDGPFSNGQGYFVKVL